jgi:hypothetical protein
MIATRKIVPAILIVICLAVAWMVITNHAQTAHLTETWSSMRVLERFQKQGGRDCDRLEVAACVRQNQRNGLTIRGYCEYRGSGLVGIWGWSRDQGVYVTGYQEAYAMWQQTCVRDGCVEADVSLLLRVLK